MASVAPAATRARHAGLAGMVAFVDCGGGLTPTFSCSGSDDLDKPLATDVY